MAVSKARLEYALLPAFKQVGIASLGRIPFLFPFFIYRANQRDYLCRSLYSSRCTPTDPSRQLHARSRVFWPGLRESTGHTFPGLTF